MKPHYKPINAPKPTKMRDGAYVTEVFGHFVAPIAEKIIICKAGVAREYMRAPSLAFVQARRTQTNANAS